MSAGLEQFLKKIEEDPTNRTLRYRFLALVSEIKDHGEKVRLSLRLADVYKTLFPREAIEIANMVRVADEENIKALEIIIESLESLGRYEKAEDVRKELAELRIGGVEHDYGATQVHGVAPALDDQSGATQVHGQPLPSAPTVEKQAVAELPSSPAQTVESQSQKETPPPSDMVLGGSEAIDLFAPPPVQEDGPSVPGLELPVMGQETPGKPKGVAALPEVDGQIELGFNAPEEDVRPQDEKSLDKELGLFGAPPTPEPLSESDPDSMLTGILDMDSKRKEAAEVSPDEGTEKPSENREAGLFAMKPDEVPPGQFEVGGFDSTSLLELSEEGSNNENDVEEGMVSLERELPVAPPELDTPVAAGSGIELPKDLPPGEVDLNSPSLREEGREEEQRQLEVEASAEVLQAPQGDAGEMMTRFRESPSYEGYVMIKKANLGRSNASHWSVYLSCLIEAGYARKALHEVMDVIKEDVEFEWIESAWNSLPHIWRELDVLGFQWQPEEGADAFVRRVSRRPDPKLIRLIV